ncbi:MAG: hypothetical protein ACREJO_12310 [Phycisphaerales bacterium]
MATEEIYIDLYQRAVRYTRDGRSTFADIAPIGRAQQHWRIKPETIKWWHVGKQTEPVTDTERPALLRRIVELVRRKHSLTLETREWSAAEIAIADAAPDRHDLPAILSGDHPEKPPPLAAEDTEAVESAAANARYATDPELAALNEHLTPPTPVAPPYGQQIDDPQLLANIDAVLRNLASAEAQGWDVAQSICRQLRWCRDVVLGTPAEAAPGPFSMGLIATREFDMYGSEPELAGLINRIQDEMQRRLNSSC